MYGILFPPQPEKKIRPKFRLIGGYFPKESLKTNLGLKNKKLIVEKIKGFVYFNQGFYLD